MKNCIRFLGGNWQLCLGIPMAAVIVKREQIHDEYHNFPDLPRATPGKGKYYPPPPLRDIRHCSETVPDIDMKRSVSVTYETTI